MALTADRQALVEAARRVRGRAYAPYSGYPVGAAIRATDGRIFTGVNVENSAFPSCVCAEVNALTTGVAAGAQGILHLAVVAEPGPDGRLAAPCGNCRQVLAEHAGHLEVILAAPQGDRVETHALSALLPAAFTAEHL